MLPESKLSTFTRVVRADPEKREYAVCGTETANVLLQR